MNIKKMIAIAGIATVSIAGLTGCSSTPKYEGEATVVSKQIDKDTRSSKVGKKRTTRTTTDYEITLDIPTEEPNRVIEVPRAKYDAIQIGQKVVIEKNRIK